MLDAEEIYYKLRDFAEDFGTISDWTDGKLGEVAQAIANDNNDPREV